MSEKQQFEQLYYNTFEPSRVPPPPRRPRLAAVLAALTDEDPEWWAWLVKHTKRWEFHGRGLVTHGAMLAGARRDGALFWRHEPDSGGRSMRPITPAEAWELLAARDLIPLSWTDHPRRFERQYHCPHGKLRGCSWCGPGIRAIPSTLAEIVAIASDAVGIETAEAIVGQQFPQHTVLWSVRPQKEIDDRLAEARRGSRQPETPEDKGLAELGYLRWSLMDPYCMVLCPML